MFSFKLNQNDVVVAVDKGLLDYLRDDARMVSVKSGCAEGVCGSCSVLVNGKAVRACKLTVAKVHGKVVMTAEGIAQSQRQNNRPGEPAARSTIPARPLQEIALAGCWAHLLPTSSALIC